MARPAFRVWSLVLFAWLLFALGSCTRQTREAPETAAEPAGQQMELTDAGRARARAESPEPAPAGSPLPSLDPRDSAFAGRRLESAPVYPIDGTIGPLSLSGMSSADEEAWATALTLLESLGAANEDAFSSLRRSVSAVLDEIARALAQPPGYTVRLAAPVVGVAGERFLLFRLVGDNVDLSGELVMESDESGWYIADIQTGTWGRSDG